MINLNEHDMYKLINTRKDIVINSQLYKYLNKGGQGLIFKINNDEVIKVFFKKLDSLQMIELVCLKMCKKALDNNLTFNLIRFNYNFIIKNKMVISMEYCDYDLDKWLLTPKDDIEWLSMIFQICNGIFILNKKLKIKHNDLKPQNILCKNIKKNKIIKYKILDKEYYVPIFTIFKITDFGHSENRECNDLSDLEHISILNNRAKVEKLINMYSKDELYNIASKVSNFEKYFMEKLMKIKKVFKKYPILVFEKMVKKSIAYFIIENSLDVNKEVNNLDPSKYIIKELKNFKNLTHKELFNNTIFDKFKIKKEYDEYYDCDKLI